MGIWYGPKGMQVEPIVLNERPALRVTQTYGDRMYLIAYCRSVAEVSEYVDLADLVEVVDLASRNYRSSVCGGPDQAVPRLLRVATPRAPTLS